jgi:uncharacterized protein YciI
MSTKYVLLYRSADGVAENAPRHFAAHSAHVDAAHAAGDLEMVGTFADPQADGAMSIFASAEAAERFAREDPFVVSGVVREWRLLEWNEILT